MYPSRQEIINFASDSRFIKDPFFEGCSIETYKNTRTNKMVPYAYGGGFSQVFKINKNDESWAFKVWVSEILEIKSRYNEISLYLNDCKLPYFLNFFYIEKGILVEDQFLDTLRMKWVDGHTLVEYISLNLGNTAVLEKLAEDFLVMVKELHQNSISHGDLQQGNIFIAASGEIKLIDYDSVCVPNMIGQKDITRGMAGYQHPSRFTAGLTTSIKVDHFSELIIYLSILAIAENPTLWGKYKVVEAEYRLLFTLEDFLAWEDAAIRDDLKLLSQRIRDLLNILENYLAAHLNLKPFYS